jgi:2-polyprenyl-6-methoxyphenol hydroxylase-like FAD-dependent oxidoreductase
MKNALIIGGGIAGMVSAMALQRAGIESVVYEAYPESAGLDAGAFLTVAVNGFDALRSIDAHRGVQAAGFPSETMIFKSGTGKTLGEMPMGGRLADGTVTVTIKRADLYGALRDEALGCGIRFEHNKRLASTLIDQDGVTAAFSDGTSARGDVLIGADGLHSITRRLIDAGAPQPHYLGLGNVGGYATMNSRDLSQGVFYMIFGKRAFFGYGKSPTGEIWWFANPPSTRELTRAELDELGNSGWKAQLTELFEVDQSPAVEIIRATNGPLVYTNSYDLRPVSRWYNERAVIIGDAAHATSPSSGQGASMAIEDAVVLAKCLRDHETPIAAFKTYERERRERVERIVAIGAKTAAYKAPNPVGRFMRDLMMPMFLKRQAAGGDDSMESVFRYHIDWNAPARA